MKGLPDRLFGTFAGDALANERRRSVGLPLARYGSRRGISYCEGCLTFQPNHGVRADKGWRCRQCRKAGSHPS